MGKLDSVLVLPIDSQFAVSTKQFGLDSIVNALLGAAVVCVSLSKLSVVPNPLSVLLYVVALGFGIAVHYSIMLALAAVSFWIVRAQGLVYGYFNFLNIARYPDVIFPWLFRLIFGWVIPVVIIAQHSRAPADQIHGSTVSFDAASNHRVDDCILALPRVLEICAATLFQRQFVSSSGSY